MGWAKYVLTGWRAMVQVGIGISHLIYLADSTSYVNDNFRDFETWWPIIETSITMLDQ